MQRLLNSHKASGQLAQFPEQVGGHDSQSQSDPLLSPGVLLWPFNKKTSLHELPVNRLPAAKDRKRHRKKGREEEGGGTGGEGGGGE